MYIFTAELIASGKVIFRFEENGLMHRKCYSKTFPENTFGYKKQYATNASFNLKNLLLSESSKNKAVFSEFGETRKFL